MYPVLHQHIEYCYYYHEIINFENFPLPLVTSTSSSVLLSAGNFSYEKNKGSNRYQRFNMCVCVCVCVCVCTYTRAALVAQMVKNPLSMQETQETWVQSLGWEDPLEEEMATHFSILAWRISMDRGRRARVQGVAKSQTQLSN